MRKRSRKCEPEQRLKVKRFDHLYIESYVCVCVYDPTIHILSSHTCKSFRAEMKIHNKLNFAVFCRRRRRRRRVHASVQVTRCLVDRFVAYVAVRSHMRMILLDASMRAHSNVNDDGLTIVDLNMRNKQPKMNNFRTKYAVACCMASVCVCVSLNLIVFLTLVYSMAISMRWVRDRWVTEAQHIPILIPFIQFNARMWVHNFNSRSFVVLTVSFRRQTAPEEPSECWNGIFHSFILLSMETGNASNRQTHISPFFKFNQLFVARTKNVPSNGSRAHFPSHSSFHSVNVERTFGVPIAEPQNAKPESMRTVLTF